ncbi:hypothetical protein NEF87_001250 [Candidatus Lokiarchaeum ossiferum]|uniref:Uncharacterized protein n=1 Tax=Candidatus Lokiarchaeum ossiferum TaxID=2951803 RepID=A0ABY6HN85_9ARCH|nr:hypothetical protein NEF87_001250 [Candidatus Lokiarchaeum sp. B-35]
MIFQSEETIIFLTSFLLNYVIPSSLIYQNLGGYHFFLGVIKKLKKVAEFNINNL